MLQDILPNSWLLTSLVIAVVAFLNRPESTQFHIVNKYPFDIFRKRASHIQSSNAEQLITKGLSEHQAVAINLRHGQKIILPASLANWVQSNRDLDHKELVRQDFFAGIPGFEAQTALHAHDEKLVNVIKTKMGQNDSIMPAFNSSLIKAFDKIWTNDKSWHTLDWQKDTMRIIVRAASSVFVGPRQTDDVEWLDLVQDYVMAYFTAVSELHAYPVWSRSIVHWFMPNVKACRKYVKRAREIMQEEIRQRGTEDKIYNDALEWSRSTGIQAEAGDIQLALAMASMFTTTEAFRQLLINIAQHSELVPLLRDEVSQAISEHGITVAATSKMVLLDSVMKESQRLSSPLTALERIALKDVKLPDGTVLPRGTHIMVDSTNLWVSEEYPNPHGFDGNRFLRKREAGDKSSQFVQSSADYHVFGGGKHICPGRFFANNELKLALAHVLLKYDVRMDGKAQPLSVGFYKVVNPFVKFEVKRREDESEAEVLVQAIE